MKTVLKRLSPIIPLILLTVMLLSACAAETPRMHPVYTYSPGAAFTTNFNNDDPRRQIKCTIVFEVIDEEAQTDLEEHNFKIRNSVLNILGELTMPEVTTQRDLIAIAERITERVNEDLSTSSNMSLITKTYFTEFVLQ